MLVGGKRYELQHKDGSQNQPVIPQGVFFCTLFARIETGQPAFRTKRMDFARYTLPLWADVFTSGQSIRIICHHHVARLTMLKSYKKSECSCRSQLPDAKGIIFPLRERALLCMDKVPPFFYAQSLSTENFYFPATYSEMRTMPVLFSQNKTGMLVLPKIYAIFKLQHPYSTFLAARRNPTALGERPLHIAQVPRAPRPPLAGDPAPRGPATSSKRRNSQHNLNLSNPGAEHGKIALASIRA